MLATGSMAACLGCNPLAYVQPITLCTSITINGMNVPPRILPIHDITDSSNSERKWQKLSFGQSGYSHQHVTSFVISWDLRGKWHHLSLGPKTSGTVNTGCREWPTSRLWWMGILYLKVQNQRGICCCPGYSWLHVSHGESQMYLAYAVIMSHRTHKTTTLYCAESQWKRTGSHRSPHYRPPFLPFDSQSLLFPSDLFY